MRRSGSVPLGGPPPLVPRLHPVACRPFRVVGLVRLVGQIADGHGALAYIGGRIDVAVGVFRDQRLSEFGRSSSPPGVTGTSGADRRMTETFARFQPIRLPRLNRFAWPFSPNANLDFSLLLVVITPSETSDTCCVTDSAESSTF